MLEPLAALVIVPLPLLAIAPRTRDREVPHLVRPTAEAKDRRGAVSLLDLSAEDGAFAVAGDDSRATEEVGTSTIMSTLSTSNQVRAMLEPTSGLF